MNQARKFIVPGYMKYFNCIGSACEDSCCIGWNVDIDQQTYLKYKKIRDAELTPIFEKHLKRNRATPSEAQYGEIKLKANPTLFEGSGT
jgi:lysine-N-methylase